MAPEMNLESRFRWRDFIHSGGTLFMDTCPDSRTMEEHKAFNQSWKDWGRSIFLEPVGVRSTENIHLVSVSTCLKSECCYKMRIPLFNAGTRRQGDSSP